MALSVSIVTRDSATYITPLLQAARGIADELVIAVDGRSQDATEEVCRPFADRLFRLEPFGDVIEGILVWLMDQCHGDWILRLDDDELPSAGLVRALPDLMSDRAFTHYWLRRRWLVGPDAAHWLTGTAWWPDWQLRLFRNIPSLVHVPGLVHTSYDVQGAGRYVLDGSLYHLDYVVHSAQERRHKAERYECLAPGNEHWDQYVVRSGQTLATEANPVDDPPYALHAGPRPAGHRACATVAVSAAELQGQRGDLGPTPELFSAQLTCLDCPSTMAAGQPLCLTLEVCNSSSTAWSAPASGSPPIRLTYHWLTDSGQRVRWEGTRAELPHTLQPGQSTVVPLWVLPPVVAGTYLLQWDLVIEGVAWFSLRGWPAPVTPVRVVQADFPLSARMARRFMQSLGVSADDLDSPDRRARAAAELQRNGAVRLDRVATPALQLRKLPVVRRLRRPPLTVLMTAYNSARYLAESTASVLSQSFDDFEFLIVDDGSDDWTADALANIATDSRVRVFRHSHQGNPRSLNAGLAQARAQLIAIMDSDDVALPGRLEAEIKYLDEHPECVLVGGQVTLIDADGQPSAEASGVPQIKLAHEEIDLALLTAGWPIAHPTVVMRTAAVRQVGGYCAEFSASADHDLFLRLAEHGQLANLPQTLLKYRRHSASVTARFPREGAQSVAEAIRRAVRRRASRKPTQTGSC